MMSRRLYARVNAVYLSATLDARRQPIYIDEIRASPFQHMRLGRLHAGQVRPRVILGFLGSPRLPAESLQPAVSICFDDLMRGVERRCGSRLIYICRPPCYRRKYRPADCGRRCIETLDELEPGAIIARMNDERASASRNGSRAGYERRAVPDNADDADDLPLYIYATASTMGHMCLPRHV